MPGVWYRESFDCLVSERHLDDFFGAGVFFDICGVNTHIFGQSQNVGSGITGHPAFADGGGNVLYGFESSVIAFLISSLVFAHFGNTLISLISVGSFGF